MIVTIDGDRWQVLQAARALVRALAGISSRPKSTKNKNYRALFATRHKLLRRAFDLVRHDRTRGDLALALGKSLGGSLTITDDILIKASEVCAATGATSDAELIDQGIVAHREIEAAPKSRYKSHVGKARAPAE